MYWFSVPDKAVTQKKAKIVRSTAGRFEIWCGGFAKALAGLA
jgi:hypothetical protein